MALWQRWADRRDPQAFREIVSRYASMVYLTCARVLHNPADAEDITQECFEVLARARRGPTEHLGAWLHRVATNRALDRIRSERRREAREAAFVAEQPSLVEPAWNDVYTFVDEALAELPDELRIPVVAHYLLGESHAEIAHAIGASRRTVSRRIARGVELIGESLKKRGVGVTSGVLAALMAANMAEASAVPVQLAAVLGRLALAQSANAVGAANSTFVLAAKLAGGLLVMKKMAVIIVVVVGALFAFWALKPHGAAQNIAPAKVLETASQDRALPGSVRSSNSTETLPTHEKSDAPAGDVAAPGISGQVVDADTGNGVAGAKVVAMENLFATEKLRDGEAGGQKAEAVTDDDGEFEIAQLRAGGYLVVKEAGPGDYMASLAQDIANVWLKDGVGKKGVLLRTRRGGTVSGVITAPDGSPVAHASVTLESARDESFQGVKSIHSDVRGETQTDAAGQYSIRGVTLGKSIAITASAAGYSPVHSPELCLAGPGTFKRVDLRLGRGSAISGWVEDRDGKRQPGVEITLEIDFEGRSHLDAGLVMTLCRSMTGLNSDENGLFRVEGLPVGPYHLFAGGIRQSPYGELGGGVCVKLDGLHDAEGVVLRDSSVGQGEHSISGHVSNAEGTPVAGAQVNVLQEEIAQNHWAVHTNDKGAFLLDGLAPGKFFLAITAAGYAQMVLTSVPLDEPDLVVTLQRNVVVRGRVLERDGGRPLAGATVAVAQNDGRTRMASNLARTDAFMFDRTREDILGKERATTDGDGAFEFTGIEPGRVQLKAERAGYATASGAELLVEPGQPVENVTIFMERGATVEGVVRAANGALMAGASILLLDFAIPGETRYYAEERLVLATRAGEGSRDIRAITDDSGHFAVDGLADGDYWMRAVSAGYACSTAMKVSISNAGSQSGVVLVLDPGGTIEGRVTQAGLPRPDVIVQATRRGIDGDCIRVYTNAEGYYIIEHVLPGEHQIRAVDISRPGNAGLQISQVIIVSGNTIRQDFEYSGHVVKGVVSGLANPAECKVAVLNIPEGMSPEAPFDPSIDWPSFVAGTSEIRADAGYFVENLADGVYKVEVYQLKDDVPVPKGVWKTITVADADLDVDLHAKD